MLEGMEANAIELRDILVPIDFSPISREVVTHALALIEPDAEVTLLHVIDSGFVGRFEADGFGTREEAVAKLRERADQQLEELVDSFSETSIKWDQMIATGKPFAEILRVSKDFDFQMIVIGIRSQHGAKNLEQFLFGSTAEKILRGTTIPVICVPVTSS